jgi:hypothetical protein
MIVNNFKRGSEWRKWDLHVHSLFTHLNNQFSVNITNEKAKQQKTSDFIKKIKDENIYVVGLTNYFNFSDDDFELKKKLEENNIVVFMNLELRLTYTNKEDECCDFHIVFDNQVSNETIKQFLSNVDAKIGLTNNKKLSNLSCDDFGGAVVEFEEIQNNLKKESLGLQNKYLLGFLSRGKGNARSASIYEDIAKNTDFLIHSTNNQDNLDEDFEYWKSQNKPLLQSSDSHKIEDIGNKFTWIKANTTFNGLKQILYSIDGRISFNENDPSENKMGGMIIDKICYGNNDEVVFNIDLNSIIGYRGNGKSILLKTIAMKIDEDGYRKKVGEGRFDRDKKWFDDKFPDAKIIWKDNIENGRAEDNQKKIFYLPQGYLSNLAYKENEQDTERYNFLMDLLRKNDSFRNAELKVNLFINNNSQEIQKLIDLVFSETEKVSQLKENNKSLGNIESIKIRIGELDKKIKIISDKNQISPDDNKNYEMAKSNINVINKQILVIKQDSKILSQLKNADDLVEISNFEFDRLSSELRDEIEKEIKNNSNNKFKQIISTKIAELEKLQTELENKLKEKEIVITNLEPKFKQQKELSDLSNQKIKLEQDKTIFEENVKNIQSASKSKRETIANIETNYFKFKTQQENIFQTVSFEEFDFIKIEIDVKNVSDFRSNFIERNINLKGLRNGAEETKKYFNIENNTVLDKSNFSKIVLDLIDEKITLKVGVKDNKQVVRDLLDNPCKIDFLDSIKLKTSDTLFRNMTGGQKAITMLELIFKFDTSYYPILLDQPEDDLDTKGVATSVVDFIKNQKQNRQIFIVSHNGSLVVCSDSEELIIANNKNNNFSYATGAIEDSAISKEIIEILEGGKEALQLRINKLGIEIQ